MDIAVSWRFPWIYVVCFRVQSLMSVKDSAYSFRFDGRHFDTYIGSNDGHNHANVEDFPLARALALFVELNCMRSKYFL
jgi:hypothetical protein